MIRSKKKLDCKKPQVENIFIAEKTSFSFEIHVKFPFALYRSVQTVMHSVLPHKITLFKILLEAFVNRLLKLVIRPIKLQK